MKTVHAIFENGVFRPIEPVDLPEHLEVVFEPRPADSPRKMMTAEGLREFIGTVTLIEDPLEFQKRLREAWS